MFAFRRTSSLHINLDPSSKRVLIGDTSTHYLKIERDITTLEMPEMLASSREIEVIIPISVFEEYLSRGRLCYTTQEIGLIISYVQGDRVERYGYEVDTRLPCSE